MEMGDFGRMVFDQLRKYKTLEEARKILRLSRLDHWHRNIDALWPHYEVMVAIGADMGYQLRRESYSEEHYRLVREKTAAQKDEPLAVGDYAAVLEDLDLVEVQWLIVDDETKGGKFTLDDRYFRGKFRREELLKKMPVDYQDGDE